MARKKTIIGWREYLSLPEWGVDRIRAKIDTGARTSALHVEDVVHLGEDRLRFNVVKSRRYPEKNTTVEAKAIRVSRVRSSTGVTQERYVVATKIILGGIEKTVEMSLVSRKNMLCRMLIGRTALAGDFLVNVDFKDSGQELRPEPKS